MKNAGDVDKRVWSHQEGKNELIKFLTTLSAS